MTQIVEEGKGCAGREHPGHNMVVVGYGKGQSLEIASHTFPMIVPRPSSIVLYPFTLV